MSHLKARQLGGKVSSSDGTYVLNEYNTRIPDVAYISALHHNQQKAHDGYFIGAPDLAVKVISPSNSLREMQQRAGKYFAAGTHLVWLVDYAHQRVIIYRQGGEVQILSDPTDLLEDGEVLLSFQLSLADLFAQAE